MNTALFKVRDDLILGYEISDHCTADDSDEQGKIVCSAVSSAAFMAANTITEIIGAKADAVVAEAFMGLTVTEKLDECQDILNGLHLHLSELAQQFEQLIEIKILEV